MTDDYWDSPTASVINQKLWARGEKKRERKIERSLTISGHAHVETLLEAAVLAAVAVHAHDQAALVLHTHLVVDVLLDAAAEETLAAFTGVNAVMEARRDVPTHLTQEHHASCLCEVHKERNDWLDIIIDKYNKKK